MACLRKARDPALKVVGTPASNGSPPEVVPAGVSPPRLHSLRHSFAVGCLLRWYREGIDPATRLHQLSTFMGHVDPSSTQVYLTITPALLEEANRRFERFAEPAWMETAR
jgi:integrase